MELEEISSLSSEHDTNVESPIVSEGSAIPLQPQTHLRREPICLFSRQEHDALESKERSKSAAKLCGLILFYLVVMAAEIVGGVKANSLALITDAAHLLTDVAGFSISLFTVWASGWKATSHQTFGFSRLEVLGTLLSIQLIWLISGILIYEAADRILHKYEQVNGKIMFAIAAFGFLINLIMITWLGHDHHTHHACGHEDHCHDHEEQELQAITEEEQSNLLLSSPVKTKILNINLQGAYLHVMADLIQSAGVMISGAFIWAKPDWLIIDLICTLLFSGFALSATLPMLRNIFGILMERAPSEIDIGRLESDLKSVKGVCSIHEVHVWALTSGKTAFSCHVIAEPGAASREILNRIRDISDKTYRIHHMTVQIE